MGDRTTQYAWRKPLDVATSVVASFLALLTAILFFAGFVHHYYYLHFLGLSISSVTLPWQYTVAFAYPVLAAIWWEMACVAIFAWVLVGLVGILLPSKFRVGQWASVTGVLAVLVIVFAALAVIFPAARHSAEEVARTEVRDICLGHASVLVRIGLRAEYLADLKRSYSHDLDELLSASTVVRYGRKPSVIFPNPSARHAAIVAEDDQEYDVAIVGEKSECSNITLYRIPKRSVAFVRSYISPP